MAISRRDMVNFINLALMQKHKNKGRFRVTMATKPIICLGIESTAHTFGASVMRDKAILSNVKKSFTSLEGGMVPHKVSDHHVEHCASIIQEALHTANVKVQDLTLISFSQSPGIGHMLRVGAGCARALAILHNIPIIGVNHCVAHLEITGLLTPAKDPILLYASGANTQIIAFMEGKYRVFGETLDMGIGNFLDTFARYANLGFPGGPKIAELANQSQNYIELPYSVKGMDLHFGGMLTFLRQRLGVEELNDLCYSVQETAFAMLCEVTERALAHCNKTEVVLGGGVACNKRLQEMIRIMCEARGATLYTIPNEYYVDNAAMIAWLGILQYQAGEQLEIAQCDIQPYVRTDDITVTWR